MITLPEDELVYVGMATASGFKFFALREKLF
jgi:hypothetical protein